MELTDLPGAERLPIPDRCVYYIPLTEGSYQTVWNFYDQHYCEVLQFLAHIVGETDTMIRDIPIPNPQTIKALLSRALEFEEGISPNSKRITELEQHIRTNPPGDMKERGALEETLSYGESNLYQIGEEHNKICDVGLVLAFYHSYPAGMIWVHTSPLMEEGGKKYATMIGITSTVPYFIARRMEKHGQLPSVTSSVIPGVLAYLRDKVNYVYVSPLARIAPILLRYGFQREFCDENRIITNLLGCGNDVFPGTPDANPVYRCSLAPSSCPSLHLGK